MNKSKLSLSLVTSVIAAMAVTACSGKSSSDPKAVVSFEGYDGEKIAVVTDDVYYDYLKSASGISKFYNAMLEVLIRYEYSNDSSVLWSHAEEKPAQSYSSIEKKCKTRIEQMKKDAKKAGNYETEWKKVLDEQGVENEKELLQKLIYEMEKDEVKDWYFRISEDSLLQEYLRGTTDSTAPASFPYHIRHILASVSGGASEFYNGTITEKEALKLYTIAKALKDGKENFGEIAVAESGDTSSTEKGLKGSVGIMDRSTSFVNEFKLGIYAYDAIYSGRAAAATEQVESGLGMLGTVGGETVHDKLESIGLSYVPYGIFELLNEVKEYDTDEDGHQVNEGNSLYFPRNIYWNKYLNRHNVFVITNNKVGEGTSVYTSVNGDDITATDVDTNITAAAAGQCGFRYVEGVSKDASQLILTDENENPIVCVRSQHGIHFMIIEKSIYDNDVDAYYSTAVPGDDDYDKNSFVGYVDKAEAATYKSRAKDIESKITDFDSTYDYRLYEYFLKEEGTKVSFYNVDNSIDIESAVNNYVASQREYNYWNVAKSLNDSWRTYIELIDVQNANRAEGKRMIHELCAIKFRQGNSDDEYTKETGECYYVK